MNLKSLLLTTCLALAATPLLTACQVSQETKSESDNLSKATEAYNNGNYQEAAQLFEKSCNGGVAFSCIKMATMYAKGQGVKEDSNLAMSYMKKACDLGQADICYALQQEQKEKNK